MYLLGKVKWWAAWFVYPLLFIIYLAIVVRDMFTKGRQANESNE